MAERAVDLWGSVQQFVQKVESKEIPKPDNKSYKTIKEAVKDNLIPAKLEFSCAVAVATALFGKLSNRQAHGSILVHRSNLGD